MGPGEVDETLHHLHELETLIEDFEKSLSSFVFAFFQRIFLLRREKKRNRKATRDGDLLGDCDVLDDIRCVRGVGAVLRVPTELVPFILLCQDNLYSFDGLS